MSSRFIFIGAGNLATRLSIEFKRKGLIIEQIYSRTELSARTLAEKLDAGFTTNPHEIKTGPDYIYFMVLKDSAVHNVLPHVAIENNLLVHCSGSLPLADLDRYSTNTGVFYPLQTFSKNRDVHFDKIPVFVESKVKQNEKILMDLAGMISENVIKLDSGKRLQLHIAAVFACNFVNHFYTIASDILKAQGINAEVLHPLIMETSTKATEMEPSKAQTGPAIRFDKQIILSHLDELKDYPELRELYFKITKCIYNYHK